MFTPSFSRLLARIDQIGADPSDSEEIRLRKSLLVRGSLMFMFAGAVWGIVYIFFLKLTAGLIPLFYAIISLFSLIFFAFSRRFQIFRISQLLLILLLPFFLMIGLGGYVNSSAVILWSIISPIGALLFSSHRRAPFWLAAYLVLVVLSGILEPQLQLISPMPPAVVDIFFVLNVGVVSTIAFALMHYFVDQKDFAFRMLSIEQDRSEGLLLNVLPREIAARLKNGELTIADHHPEVTIQFADLSGFTPLSALHPPAVIVDLLNEIYSHFDSLVEKYQVEKIRTIGDNYMVASGVPVSRPDHAQALARLALDITSFIHDMQPIGEVTISFRIGINSSPVIAGVIGHKKFVYDVWGDTVNIASRMESHGTPGKIQISQQTYELIKNEFVCEPVGTLDVKGKGQMQTWFLVAEKTISPS